MTLLRRFAVATLARSRAAFPMKGGMAFSSTDLVNWSHHGAVLSVKNLAWADDDAGPAGFGDLPLSP